MCPQTPRDFIAIHLRQPNIEEYDFGFQFLRCTESAGRSICGGDLVTLKLQHHREGIRGVFVVIDHEDSAPWRGEAGTLPVWCTGVLHRRQVDCHSSTPSYPSAVRAD